MANHATVTLRTIEGEGLVFEGRVPSGGTIVMDSGKAPQGPTPVETLLLSLGACSGMDVIGILRKKRQVVLGYEVTLAGDRRAEHPRRFTRIEVVHRLRGRNLQPKAIEEAIRLSATAYCTVTATLAPDVEIVSRYEIIPA
jgi:putative redox protein